MFVVAYQTNWETHVDLGRCVVFAPDQAEATRIVFEKYNLSHKRTRCTVEAVNDGLMLLSKRSITHESAVKNNLHIEPGNWSERPLSLPFNCQVLAVVYGEDESHALKRLAHTVINRANEVTSGGDRYVTRLMIQCEARVPGHEKPRGILGR